MSATAELAQRVRISDPRPDRCAACFRGAEDGVRFVDFDAAIDRGTFVDPSSVAVLESIDDLHLCEACVAAATECLGIKPELHSRALREIRRVELERDHWHGYAKRLEATLVDRPAEEPTRGRPRASKRKAA